MPNLRWQELLIIVALVVLLFGAKRLPDAARGLGRSLRIFKSETKGLVEDGDQQSTEAIDSAHDAKQQAKQQAKQEIGSESTGASEVPETTETPDRSRTDG